jgi:broad specificity phosphatase PhoE
VASVSGVTTILLVRHGETDWNLERRVQGHSDQPLNATGRAQAQALADKLADEHLDAVYASDLARAHETARLVAAGHGLPVVVLPELREKDFGTWEGLTDEEIRVRFPEARPGGQWGDGETYEQMSSRVVAALRRIAARHPDGRVLVVAHGGPVRAVLVHCDANRESRIANCDLVRVEVEGGALRVH